MDDAEEETVTVKMLPTELSRERKVKMPSRAMLPAGLFVLLLALFLSFPSRDYNAVDGALRSLAVYDEQSFSFHGNNHLLYPFWVWTWSHLAGAVGIHASNAFEFVRISQAMNAFFGAGAVVALFSILQVFVEPEIALLYSLGFGFSTAFLLHATNSAEPMPGLFFCLVAMRVLLAGLRRANGAILATSGVLFALALASYEAMGTIAGMGVFACLWWAWIQHKDHAVVKAIVSLLWVGFGGFLAVCGVYGTVYAKEGTPVAQMPHQFLALGGGSEVYSGFSVSRMVNTPIGLLRNLFFDAPPGYSGIRALLQDPRRALWIPLMAVGLIVAASVAWLASKALRNAARQWSWGLALAGWGGLVLLCFPLLYWDPQYDKLWLLPLAALAALLAFASRPGLLAGNQRRILTALLVLVFCAESVANLSMVLRSHFEPTPHLAEAEDLSRAIAPNDWVVLGFDDISSLWLSFWGLHAKVLMLPASNAEAAGQWLGQARRATQQSGARVVFVGVLDEDPVKWNAFLGGKVGIPYGLLDEYRTRSSILKTYAYQNGTLTVRSFR